MQAKQSSPAQASQDLVDGGGGVATHRSASPRLITTSNSRSAQQLAHGVNSLINSHKNALAQHNNSNHYSTSIPQLSQNSSGIKQSINRSSAVNNAAINVKSTDINGSLFQKQHTGRQEVDKSTTADSHISQLKMVKR